jgi:hypothetical protein
MRFGSCVTVEKCPSSHRQLHVSFGETALGKHGRLLIRNKCSDWNGRAKKAFIALAKQPTAIP